MFENVNCNLCGSDKFRVVYPSHLVSDTIDAKQMTVSYNIKEYCQIVRCTECGFVYANPRDKQDKLKQAYEQLGEKEYLVEQESRTLTFKKDLKLVEKYASQGKLLDLGCAAGLFLDVANKDGWETYGVEASQITSEYARQNYGLKVFTGTIFEAGLDHDFFDVITAWDVVEHVTDPLNTLKELNRIQKPGGYLVSSTIDFNSLLSRVLKTKWPCLIRSHIFYFTRKSLTALLKKAGYKTIKITTYARIFKLKYIVSLIKPHSKFLHAILHFFMKLLHIGNLRVSLNLFDCITVIAKKE